jgi:predicted TIM-barrel fold metal-dependent hydrolase
MTTTDRSVTLLPDPEPRPINHLVISVDDHLIEPPQMFDGRMPAKFADVTPRIVNDPHGIQAWEFEGELMYNMGLNAVAGRPPEEWSDEPQRFEDLRPGCYDVDARIRDMDLNGVYASLCFPSRLAGFGGARFAEAKDPELGLACMRAWNDWFLEEWSGKYPGRLIALQITWLKDPEIAAAEIRANAERGFKAVSFPESPRHLDLPSLHTDYWDPFLRACEETDTVICLHTGSSGRILTDPLAPRNAPISLFPAYSMVCAADWLWSTNLTKFPGLKIALAEGGIGWLPMFLDRLEYSQDRALQAFLDEWHDERLPTEVLLESFYFCMLDDPSALPQRHRIGLDHIMFEVDYPHGDGTWPNTQAFIDDQFAGLPEDEVAKITAFNAAALFRHPIPTDGIWGELAAKHVHVA